MAAKHIDDIHELNFEEITDSSMMAIVVYHEESMQPVYMNRLAIETLELGENFAISDLIIEKLYPEQGSSRGRCFSGEYIHDAGFYQDIMMRRLNGYNFMANLGVRLIQNSEYLMLMFQDVTFQKKLQREVQVKQQELMRSYTEILEQNAELQTLSEAKDKLITLSSHELRTPLSAIIAMTETLSLGVVDDKDEIQKYHEDIHSESKNLMHILNSMLEVLKLTTGKMPYFINENDLVTYTTEAITQMQDRFESAGVEITTDFPEKAVAYIDTVRLKKSFEYIMDNSLKHCPKSEHFHVKIEQNEDFVKISFSDKGPGIPTDFHETIFDEFTTLGDIDTHSKGAGLSLTIAKLSTQQMGGKVYVNPDYKEGSEFIFEIPKTKVLDEELYSDFNPYEDIEF